MKKGTFSEKGKNILGDKIPNNLESFLENKSDISDTGNNTDGHAGENQANQTSKTTERQEIKLTKQIFEKLRTYAFEKRVTKSFVVNEALNVFFKKQGY